MENKFDRGRFAVGRDIDESRHKSNIMGNTILILLFVVYPLGIWFKFWSFSPIVLLIITVGLVYSLYQIFLDEIYIRFVEVYSLDVRADILENKVDTDKQLSELLALNKELLAKVNKFESLQEKSEDLEENIVTIDTLQLEKNILEKIDKSEEQFDTVIAEKTEVIKTALAWHTRTLDLDIKANKLEFKPLEIIIEQFEELAEKNEELYSMYEPIIMHVQDLTEHMEYGNILSEQIRVLMEKNTEVISKNEELTQQVEQLLSYQRNKVNK